MKIKAYYQLFLRLRLYKIGLSVRKRVKTDLHRNSEIAYELD